MRTRSHLRMTAWAALVAVSLAVIATAAAAPMGADVIVSGKGTRITFGGPSVWPSGVTRITATSRGGEQEFTLLHFHPGYGYRQFLADGRKAQGRTPAAVAAMRRVFARTDFLGGANVFPGTPARFTVTLHPGTYYLGAMNQHPVFKQITVTATKNPAAPPSSEATVTAYDFGFHTNRATLPASGTITIRNTGRQIHRLLLVPVKPGTTRTEIGTYLKQMHGRPDTRPPAFALSGPQLGTAMISPGEQIDFSYHLRRGTYALICFQTDSRTGIPQALEGMYATATLR